MRPSASRGRARRGVRCGAVRPTAPLTPSPRADPKKPAFGVVLTYAGGESTFCPETVPGSGVKRNRTFSIDVQCAPVAPTTPQTLQSVMETNVCDYRLSVKSIAGCPTACITGDTTICSNSGVCGFDTTLRNSKCVISPLCPSSSNMWRSCLMYTSVWARP